MAVLSFVVVVVMSKYIFKFDNRGCVVRFALSEFARISIVM